MFQVSTPIAITAVGIMAMALGVLFRGTYLYFKKGKAVGANMIALSFVTIIAIGGTLLIVLLTP